MATQGGGDVIGPCRAKPNLPAHFVPSGQRHCEYCGETVLCPHRSLIGSCSECGREACARGEHVRSGGDATHGWMVSHCVYCGASDDTVAGDSPLCPHGAVQAFCGACNQTRLRLWQTPYAHLEEFRRSDDARSQLWARVYAAEYEVCRRRDGSEPGTVVYAHKETGITETTVLACIQSRARRVADAAVRDFDEHYLGREPVTKG